MSLRTTPLHESFGLEVFYPKDRRQERNLAKRAAEAAVYRHRWQQGDVVFWDNGCTLQRRDPIAADRARYMKRMTIFLRGERRCLPY